MTRNWALVVGINNYNPLNFTPLKYAKRDAERVSEFFKSTGFEVCCFTDDSPPLTLPSGHTIPTQPTFGNLITFLQDRFETEFLNTGDNCWFFFAGHGECHQGRDYLMPIDANSRGTEVIAGLTVNYVRERLSRCGADNVIIILDACRNQGSREGLGIGQDNQKGVITLWSCQPTQKSWEIDELAQGVFTYTFLEALQLSGESSCATVERLGKYLKQRVPALCKQYGKVPAQLPRISVDPLEKQNFILIPKYAQRSDIDQLKLDVFRLLMEQNPDLKAKSLALAEQICIRLNFLSMGKDLEVIDLLATIRSDIRNKVNKQYQSASNSNSAAPSSATNTADTTTIKDATSEDFYVPTDTTYSISLPPQVNRKELDECNPSKILYFTNIEDSGSGWTYTLDCIRDVGGSIESRVFELYWTSMSRGAEAASKGDLMLLSQQARITHVVEVLDDDLRESPKGYFRWVRAVWMPNDEDWHILPNHREIIGFEPPTIAGRTACSLANLVKFQEAWKKWNSFRAFQQHIFQVLMDIVPPHYKEMDEGLSSEHFGANYYAELRDLLAAKDWQAADKETETRMKEVMNRQQKGRLQKNDVMEFPCLDLRNIDRLWIQYSGGQFGFSVQRRIWESCGSPTKNNSGWEKFGVTVGWRTKGFLGRGANWKNTNEFTFDTSAPLGHLPGTFVVWLCAYSVAYSAIGTGLSDPVPNPRHTVLLGLLLFSRVKACG